MSIYSGKTKSLKNLITLELILTPIPIAILLFLGITTASIIISLLIISIIWFVYKGIILKIILENDTITIVRPLYNKTIHLNNIAFCAVHGIEDNSTLIYAFVKKKYKDYFTVKGVKPFKDFKEIVEIMYKENHEIPLNINFNMAIKIPISFVENSDELKDIILSKVNDNQKKILNIS